MNALELCDLVKHYPSGEEIVRAVDGVSLTLAPGEFVALYGPSGSGKTTLLLLSAGILAPDRGAVRFGGRDLAVLSREASAEHRRSLGFVFQSFHLMPGVSAIDNASVKLLAEGWSPARARKQAAVWLDRVGLRARAQHVPERLSMGERQRVAIARALANEPKLILADEPTGNLDSERGRETLALISDVCRTREIGVLLVTHDPDAADFADRIFDLRDGRLLERAAALVKDTVPDRDAASP